jgi:predicted nucleic acid-binding protein
VTVLVDTGGLYALADADSEAHEAVRAYLEQSDEVLLVPVTVLPEADYLIASRLGVQVELGMLRSIVGGEFRLEPVTMGDLARSVEIIEQYADSDVGFVDASLVAVAERLGVRRILTLDHRHFRMLRPRHCDTFELVP